MTRVSAPISRCCADVSRSNGCSERKARSAGVRLSFGDIVEASNSQTAKQPNSQTAKQPNSQTDRPERRPVGPKSKGTPQVSFDFAALRSGRTVRANRAGERSGRTV